MDMLVTNSSRGMMSTIAEWIQQKWRKKHNPDNPVSAVLFAARWLTELKSLRSKALTDDELESITQSCDKIRKNVFWKVIGEATASRIISYHARCLYCYLRFRAWRVLSSLVDYSGLPMSWVKRLPILLVNEGRGFGN